MKKSKKSQARRRVKVKPRMKKSQARRPKATARRRVKVKPRVKVLTPVFQRLDRELAAIARKAARAAGRPTAPAPVAPPTTAPDVSRELIAWLKATPRTTALEPQSGTPLALLPPVVVKGVYGACVISPSDIVMIGPVFEKPGKDDQRIIGLRGGHECYVLDTRENITKLIGPIVAEELNVAYETAKSVAAKATAAVAVSNQLRASLKAQADAPAADKGRA